MADRKLWTYVCFIIAVVLTAASVTPAHARTEQATFAGGCFWCVEEFFEAAPGVTSAVSGYTGGRTKNPSYEEVSSGRTGHAEAVLVTYDPAKISYRQLLDLFWRNIDPTDGGGQFCDRGGQYRSAVFFHSEEQRREAEASKSALERSKRLPAAVATTIVQAATFYPAEEYHQDYSRKNPVRYKFYRSGCGRDRRLKEIWGVKR